MAVLEVKKLNICAMRKDEKEIMQTLQRWGLMQIDGSAFEGTDVEIPNTTEERMKLERAISSMENALEVMETYSPEKKGMFASLEGKTRTAADRLDEVYAQRNKLMETVETVNSNMKTIVENRVAVDRNKVAMETLEPWLLLDVPMDFTGTDRTSFLIGSIGKTDTVEEIYDAIGEYVADLSQIDVTVVSKDKYQTCIAVVCLSEYEKSVENGLHALGFVRISGSFSGIAADEKKRLEDENLAMEKENEDLAGQIAKMAEHRSEIRMLSDVYRATAKRLEAMNYVPQSEKAFFISGYAAAKDAESIAKKLDKRFELYVDVTDPAPDEDVPVILKNKGLGSSVEGIVDSYGLPHKGEVDPSSIMGIFYVILFGMMLSDAAYGVIVTVTMAVLLKKFKNMEESMRKSLKMFMYCGISTIVWGVLFGGYFGDAVDVISKTFMGEQVSIPPLWFAPLNDPMRLLMYCMIIGVIHMYVGMGIKGYMYIKKKEYANFFCDVVLWLCMLTGLVMMLLPTELFYSLSGWEISYPASVALLSKILAAGGAIGILFTAGRGRKNPALRLALGAYDLYNITGWLSDLLSYSRLLALGLATGVIASVFNQIGAMGGDSVFGIIFFIIVFIIGHVFNMSINILGAYVHTNRLQYVEFFGKFYEGGGRIFEPFKTGTKYVDIREEKE